VALDIPNTPASTFSRDNRAEEQVLVDDEVDSVGSAPKQEEEEEKEETEGVEDEEEDSDDSYLSYSSSPRNYELRYRHGGTPRRKEQKPEDLGSQFRDKIHCVGTPPRKEQKPEDLVSQMRDGIHCVGTPPGKEQKPEDLGSQFRDKIHCVMYRVGCRHSSSKMYLDAPKQVHGNHWSDHCHLTGTVVVEDFHIQCRLLGLLNTSGCGM
jgi:hypothetical protein